jgi:hypothetical protein
MYPSPPIPRSAAWSEHQRAWREAAQQRQQWQREWQRASWTSGGAGGAGGAWERGDRAWDGGAHYGESEDARRERRARTRAGRAGAGPGQYEEFINEEEARVADDERRAMSMAGFALGVAFAVFASYRVITMASHAVRESGGEFVDAWYNPVTERWEVPYSDMYDPAHMVNRKKLLRRMPADMVFDPKAGEFVGNGRGYVAAPSGRSYSARPAAGGESARGGM